MSDRVDTLGDMLAAARERAADTERALDRIWRQIRRDEARG